MSEVFASEDGSSCYEKMQVGDVYCIDPIPRDQRGFMMNMVWGLNQVFAPKSFEQSVTYLGLEIKRMK